MGRWALGSLNSSGCAPPVLVEMTSQLRKRFRLREIVGFVIREFDGPNLGLHRVFTQCLVQHQKPDLPESFPLGFLVVLEEEDQTDALAILHHEVANVAGLHGLAAEIDVGDTRSPRTKLDPLPSREAGSGVIETFDGRESRGNTARADHELTFAILDRAELESQIRIHAMHRVSQRLEYRVLIRFEAEEPGLL